MDETEHMNYIRLFYVKYRPSSAKRRLEAQIGNLDTSNYFTYATAQEIAKDFAEVFMDEQFGSIASKKSQTISNC